MNMRREHALIIKSDAKLALDYMVNGQKKSAGNFGNNPDVVTGGASSWSGNT